MDKLLASSDFLCDNLFILLLSYPPLSPWWMLYTHMCILPIQRQNPGPAEDGRARISCPPLNIIKCTEQLGPSL